MSIWKSFDVDGTHIGTVDRVEGDCIKMTGDRVKLNQKASALKLQAP